MTGRDIIKKLMEDETVTNAQLAKRLDVTQATLWARLNNQNVKDMPLTVFNDMLNALGYDIVIRKRAVDGGKEIVAEIDEPTKEETRGRPRITDSKRTVENEIVREVPAK